MAHETPQTEEKNHKEIPISELMERRRMVAGKVRNTREAGSVTTEGDRKLTKELEEKVH